MKVFIDTNILIDILCKREPFVDDALTLFDWAIDGKIDMIVSNLTIANVNLSGTSDSRLPGYQKY